MSIQVKCGVCSRQFATPDESRGRRFKCPACGNPIEVPNAVESDEDLFDVTRWKEPLLAAAQVAAPPVDPDLTQRDLFGGGGGSLPPVRVKSQRTKIRMEGGPIDFLGDHKLVLAVFVFGVGFLWLVMRFDIGVAGIFLAMLGIILGAGAWRSQSLVNRHHKDAEDWRYLEQVAGVIILLGLGTWVTWFFGVRIWDAIGKGQDFGFSKVVYTFILERLGLWIVAVGFLVFLYLMSGRFGFFKPASWTYVVGFLLTWIYFEGMAWTHPNRFRDRTPMARHEPPPPFEPRINRPGFGSRPTDPSNRQGTESPQVRKPSRFDLPPEMKPQPKVSLSPSDRPKASMSGLSGNAAADEFSSSAGTSTDKIPEVRLGQGLDSVVMERRPAVRWTAKPDPQSSNVKSQISDPKTAKPGAAKKLAEVPLTDDALVVVPQGGGPWLAVSSGGKETASSMTAYNLLTLEEREIKGKIAVGSPRAISADGNYFAAYNKEENAVDVWSFEKNKSIARLKISPLKAPSIIDFASGNRLVVAGDAANGFNSSAQCLVWNLPNDTRPRIFALPKAVKFETGIAIVSPGGKYLAAYHDASVWVIDLDSGKLRGVAKINERDSSELFHTKGAGLNFSPDGEELVCLASTFGGSRLTAWNMKDGVIKADHKMELRINHPSWEAKSKILECFPDRKAWLVDGGTIIDAKTGESFAVDLNFKERVARETKFTVYGLADSERLILGTSKMVSVWTIPRGIDGEFEKKSLVVSIDDLPSGMIPDNGPRRGGRFTEDDDEEEQTLAGEDLELASRRYRQQSQLKILAGPDDKLSTLLGWYPAAKRSAFGLRVGVGAQAPDGSRDVIPLASTKSLSEFTGPVGGKVVRELRKRFGQDSFGDWPQTEDSAARGIIYVGIGPREKVLAAAKKAEFDAVVMLEVERKQIGNTKRFDMLLRIRVTDATGEPVWVSPALSSEKAVAAERDGQDIVKPLLADVFARIGDNYTLKPMPAAKADAAKDRVKAILKGDVPAAEKLTAAAELRHYQIANVLSAEDALPAYKKLFDDQTAEAMAGGDVRKRRAALEKWGKENGL